MSGANIALLDSNASLGSAYSAEVCRQVECDALYANYIVRQAKDVATVQKDEGITFPADFDFLSLAGLTTEVARKLEAARPSTLGQASRIEGVTPAALTLLLAKLRSVERVSRSKSAKGF